MATELKVVIDWNADTFFDGTYDDITADIKSIDWSLGLRQLYQSVADESTCNIVLDNVSGRYLPENSNSPLFGNILPNRRIKVMYSVNGVDTPLWVGWIEAISPAWDVGPYLQPVKIACTGSKRLLEDQQVDLSIFNDVTGDVIISDVLTQVNIPPAVSGAFILDHEVHGRLPVTLAGVSSYSDIETGIMIIPQYGDLAPATALEVITEVTAGERGKFFFDRQGKAIWWNRHHLLKNNTDDAVVDSANGIYKPVGIDYVFGKDVANVIRITSNPRQTADISEIIWELDSPITIAPNQTATIEARLRKANGVDAGAATVTPAPTFESGFATISVSAKGGKSIVNIINASNTVSAILSALTLSGVPIVNQNKMDIVATDGVSAAAYGIKEESIDLGVISDYDSAFAVAAFELSRRKDPIGNIRTLTYDRTFDGDDNDFLLDWTIGTRLNVVVDEFGHDHDYFVMSEKHQYDAVDLLRHRATLTLEPAGRSTFWILDDPVHGLLDQNHLAY